MRHRVLISALALITADMSLSLPAASAPSRQRHSPWLRTETPRFEIHYLTALAPQLDGVVRSAERAYDRISGRLRFRLPAKVPLVMFAPSATLTRDQVVAYATSGDVAPQHPHRSRIVLPLEDGNADLDGHIVHELTHLLVAEIILPQTPGDGGVPRWVHEGIASHLVGTWSDDGTRLIRELVMTGRVPALSRLTGSGEFANPRVNDALGHAAFDFIDSRWGPTALRRFIDALIVPRVDKTYDAVFELTPVEFDAAFRRYAERRFGPDVH